MIFLVRHTTPSVAKGVCYGQSDVALANSYDQELAQIRDTIPANLEVYSSPLGRCLQLARDISTGEVTTDDRLLELNFGDWELKRWDELGQAGVDWGNDFVRYRPPGGETVLELQRRVLDFWQDFVTKKGSVSSAIVTHAGVIRVILAYQKGLPIEKAYDISVAYGEIISLDAA